MPRYHTLQLNKILITKADYELLRSIEEGNHSELAEEVLMVEESNIGYDVYPVLGDPKFVIETAARLGFSNYFINIMKAAIDDSCDMVRFTNVHAVESRFPFPDDATEDERLDVYEEDDTLIASMTVHPDSDENPKAEPIQVSLTRDHATLGGLKIMTERGPVYIGIESVDAGVSLHVFTPADKNNANDLFSAAITIGEQGLVIEDQRGNATVYDPNDNPTPGLK